jgi:1-deoxy-D-xylulose-5-phosphate reductoisomerase
MKKSISILGATGSIGVNALNVIRENPELFSIYGLSAHRQVDQLIVFAKEFNVKVVAIGDETQVSYLKKELSNVEVLGGRDGLLELASRDVPDLMINAIVGSSGMEPTIQAIINGVDVALSNKESLVMAGDLIYRLLEKHKTKLYPVDSEHSAIWQSLVGENMDDIKRLIVTGSGGPFRKRPLQTFKDITVKEALKHPNWAMGNKITIDSATMMNKGLEVIEARWLFDMPAEKIDIIVHPQSIIHSMVEFVDSSVKAQLGLPDMKIPIQYALTYPKHVATNWEPLDLIKIGELTFEAPDYERFPCIQLAYDALHRGGTTPAVLNVANEFAVYRFLKEEIRFTEIPELIQEAISQHYFIAHPSLDDILRNEEWAKQFIQNKE